MHGWESVLPERRSLGNDRCAVNIGRKRSFPYPRSAGRAKCARTAPEREKAATKPATRAAIKADPRFEGFDLVRQPRLSVMPVPAKLDKALRKMAGV